MKAVSGAHGAIAFEDRDRLESDNAQGTITDRLQGERPAGNVLEIGRDVTLQGSRRVDWRFLLRNPILGDVAYLGPATGSLPVALKRFSQSLRVLSSAESLGPAHDTPGVHELVVVHSAHVADVRSAAALVKAGGALYWEINRRPWHPGMRGIGRADRRRSQRGAFQQADLRRRHGPVAFLEQLGFVDAQVSWHRPSFEACLEIIPLDVPGPLQYVLSRPHRKLSGRFRSALGRRLMKAGLLTWFLPCLSVVARKPTPIPKSV